MKWNLKYITFLLTSFHPYFFRDNIYTWVVQSLMLLLFKSIPIYCSFSNFWTIKKQQRRKGERPYFPARQKDSEFKRPRFLATHINRKWVFFSVLPGVLILIETICPKNCSKSRHKSAKSQLSVDVRGSKTALPKLPNLNILSIIVSNLTHVYTFSYANMKTTKDLQYYMSLQYSLWIYYIWTVLLTLY